MEAAHPERTNTHSGHLLGRQNRKSDSGIRGQVDGNLYGGERVELKKSAILVGDIYTPRIAIEDGAYLKGDVRSLEDVASPQTKKER